MRAPITEEMVDFRIERSEWTIGSIDDPRLGGDLGYHRVGPILKSQFGVTFDLEADTGPEFSSEPAEVVGSRFHSADEKYVAQLSIDGFSFSRLAPYENWEAFVGEAKRVWRIYVGAVRPRAVTRVATRFINDLQLPLSDPKPFAFYLNSVAAPPDIAFNKINGFLYQHFGRDPDSMASVTCTQALRSARYEGALPVILDIDVFRAMRFPIDDDSVWPYLDRLRLVKNRVFFSLLTDACVALYL